MYLAKCSSSSDLKVQAKFHIKSNKAQIVLQLLGSRDINNVYWSFVYASIENHINRNIHWFVETNEDRLKSRHLLSG